MSTERDVARRLRDRAAQALSAYQAGGTSLRRLIDTLDAIWSGFEPSEWRDEFREHWWTLEQIYAVALDRGDLADLSSDDTREIGDAVNELEILVN